MTTASAMCALPWENTSTFRDDIASAIPEGTVFITLTGPPPGGCSRQPGGERTVQMVLVERGLRDKNEKSTTDLSNSKKKIHANAIREDIDATCIPMYPGCDEQMVKFITWTGASQKIKIEENNKAFAAYESRVKSFEKCRKSLMQDIPTLCDSGLFYKGNGLDDVMLCYCCATEFSKWQYLVNPWVQHALLAPECTHLILQKGREFVELVIKTYNYINTCSLWEFRELFYGNFSLLDLNYIDRDLGYGDSRYLCIDPMVSVKMLRLCPEMLPQTSIDLEKSSLPNAITCKICYREKIDVLFIPCGHIFACIQCAVTLHECAVCREPFGITTYALKVFIEEKVFYEHTMCRVCKIGTIEMAFVPCLHVHTCYQCAVSFDSCPVCSENFCALIQVFL